jgi:endonuclease III
MSSDSALRAKADRIFVALLAEYGPPRREGRADPVGELVATIISQHTSDVNTDRAYASLVDRFGSWEEVRDAPVAAITEAIKSAGLSNIKAPRIKAVLGEISERYGRVDLQQIAQLPLAEAKAALRSLPGVGPKTAACTLLFGLGLPALPVDTHVHRVSRRLGLIGVQVGADAAHDLLEALVAPENVFAFHILLIQHGRLVCRAQRPRCPDCVVLPDCDWGRQALGLSG